MFSSTKSTIPGGHEETLPAKEIQTHSHPHSICNTLKWLKEKMIKHLLKFSIKLSIANQYKCLLCISKKDL